MIKTEFSINDLKNVFDEKKSKKYFSKTLVFPIEKKEQVQEYLRKHKNEIIEEIIKKAEEQ